MNLYGYELEPCATPESAHDPSQVRCAFTVDVEDWYQSTVDFDAPIHERVLRNMDRVRAVLDEFRIKGTFFVQGRVAETFPHLLQELLADGHEIQSHAYSHRPLYAMDRAALRQELEYSIKTVEDACGVRVTAFRAPDFSIVPENLWALEVLAESGFEVDSFEPSPGWTRSEDPNRYIWSRGRVPTGEDAVFRFNASLDSSKRYMFKVRQGYSDGSTVDWNGPESSDTPAPLVDGVSSLGGGGTTTLTIVALIVGAVGVLLGIAGLATRGRPLA